MTTPSRWETSLTNYRCRIFQVWMVALSRRLGPRALNHIGRYRERRTWRGLHAVAARYARNAMQLEVEWR